MSLDEIIERFHVSRATMKRYLKQRRETGNILPRPIPGRPPRKKAALQVGVQELLEAHPEASQQEYCHWWEAEYGISVSRASMSRAIHALGWTRTKGKRPAETRAIKEEWLSVPKLFKQALELKRWGPI